MVENHGGSRQLCSFPLRRWLSESYSRTLNIKDCEAWSSLVVGNKKRDLFLSQSSSSDIDAQLPWISREESSVPGSTTENYGAGSCDYPSQGAAGDANTYSESLDVEDGLTALDSVTDSLSSLSKRPSERSRKSVASSSSVLSGQDITAEIDSADIFSSHPFLEEDSTQGLLLLPQALRPSGFMSCPFEFLECRENFDYEDLADWKTHTMSHFRGLRPPKKALCPLCDMVFEAVDENNGPGTWDEMLSHLCREHGSSSEKLETSRPDFELFTWMWQRRLISDATYTSLQTFEGYYKATKSRKKATKSRTALTTSSEISRRDEETSRRGIEVVVHSTKRNFRVHNKLNMKVEKNASYEDKVDDDNQGNRHYRRSRNPLIALRGPECSKESEMQSHRGFKDTQMSAASGKADTSILAATMPFVTQSTILNAPTSRTSHISKLSGAHRIIIKKSLDETFNEVKEVCSAPLFWSYGTGNRTDEGASDPACSSSHARSGARKRDYDDNHREESEGRNNTQRHNDDGDANKGDGGDRQAARVSKRSNTSLRLRCPFTALGLPELISRSCVKVATPNVDDLKQYHLKVHHGLTIAQMKIERGGTEVEKWLKLFYKLFPNWQSEHVGTDPPSPFADANYQLLNAYSIATRAETDESEHLLEQMTSNSDPSLSIPGFDDNVAHIDSLNHFSVQPLSDPSSTNELLEESDVHIENFPTLPNVAALESSTEPNNGPICRCSGHTDICGRRHPNKAEESCLCCSKLLPWSSSAASYVMEVNGAKICRCQNHETLCLGLRSEYDARKCACCKGWYAWSEQATPLICRANTRDEVVASATNFDISEFVNPEELVDDDREIILTRNSGKTKAAIFEPGRYKEGLFPTDFE